MKRGKELSFLSTLDYSVRNTKANELSNSFRMQPKSCVTSPSQLRVPKLHENALLSKVRTRTQKDSTDLTVEVAALVVSAYFKPLFDSETKKFYSKQVKKTTKRLEKTTKLSITLRSKLKKETKEIKIKKLKLKSAQSEVSKFQRSVKDLKNKLEQVHKLKQILKFYQSCQFKNKKRSIIRLKTRRSMIEDYKLYYSQIIRHNNSLKEKLLGEALYNQSLKKISRSLQHQNTHFKIGNEVLGERLKGFYNACKSVLKGSFAEDLESICYYKNQLNSLVQNSTPILFEILIWIKLSSEKCYKIAVEVENLQKQIKSVSRKAKYTMKSTISKIKAKNSEINQLDGKVIKVEFLYSEISTLVEDLKRQLNLVRKNSGDPNTIMKQCKHCDKWYCELNNFNWSCKRHKYTWNKHIYWCCGKNQIDAPGCFSSKHETQEETEDTNKQLGSYCVSCKSLGHSISNCYKDPNIRSHCNLKTEVSRIARSKRIKTRVRERLFREHRIKNLITEESI